MNNATAIAIFLAVTGAIAISAGLFALHPLLGIITLGVFCLIGAAFAAKVAGLGE